MEQGARDVQARTGEGQITLTAKVVKVPSDEARSSPPNGKT